MSEEPILRELDEHGVLLVTLNRPRRKNAFNDTIRFSERGIPAVTFGPGEDGWPPINEYIYIQKSVAATQVLALALIDLLGFEAP